MNLFPRDYTCPRCGSKQVSLRAETLPPLGEVDYWAPVRDEGFRCADCGLMELCQTDAGAAFKAFHARWNDDLDKPETPEQIEEYRQWSAKVDADQEAYDRAWTWPVEHKEGVQSRAWREARSGRERAVKTYFTDDLPYPHEVVLDAGLMSEILARPDDVTPRWALVRWLREQSHRLAPQTASFIESQLRIAESFAADPRSDVRNEQPRDLFTVHERPDWWRYPDPTYVSPLFALEFDFGVGLVADTKHFRGFIEHVAIKASRFLEIADELYSLAPIRQLTITYAKGPNHDDLGLYKALLASPHLDRIRALKFPMRVLGNDNEYTKLNELTNTDIAMLADSDHLRGLRVLALEDQHKLSIAAFDALATSTKLPALSAVYFDIWQYHFPGTFTFGRVGDQQRYRFGKPPLHYWGPQLEAQHGFLPWLHVAEYYGNEIPDIEAVIENPIALHQPRRRA
jgi:transcription elongation factor Elf1